MAVSNHPIKPDLVQVGRLQLQHLEDACTVDLVRGLTNFGGGVISTTETCRNQLFAEFVEQVERRQVSTARNLDQLGKAIADLAFRKCSQELEVQERMDGGVIGSKTVLVVTVVDGNLDTDTSINQTDNSGGNADEVGVPPVGSTGKSETES